ncbi:tetratricopeptide repeat protein [Herbaspirillum sp. YR522]|uniref:tetratricopeptide repeat protein n=1 Tax=Herbaspirillum sp. YR522 TaxID=1144342 RepID=UPI00026FA270|nr:tetratricopeptide repeat protein [Herbaspirillum sp. YR522]EJN07877.1 Tfp pilus assembly protein PilF [Herbaspirillum sp. YR522]
MKKRTRFLLIAIAAACKDVCAHDGAFLLGPESSPIAPADDDALAGRIAGRLAVIALSEEPDASGRTASAAAIVPTPPPPPPSASVMASIGALPATQDDLIDQLRRFDCILAHRPDNTGVREARLLTLARLGAVDIAIAEAAHYPEVAQQVVARLHEQQVTLALRWSENTYHARAADEYPGYDRVIALAQANLQRYPDSLQLRYDLVRALRNRGRRGEAIALYTTLPGRDQGNWQGIPHEVHESAGSAYLAEKKPELAEQAFRDALAGKPDSINARLGLFYALVDQGRYRQARHDIDQLAAQPLLPDEKFSAARAAALAPAYERRFDVAQARLEGLRQEAPSSDQLRIALGKVYLWRGWPRRAHDQFSLVAAHDPDNLEADVALAETEAALGSVEAADRRLARLKAGTPEQEEVKAQLRAQEVRNHHEFTMSLVSSRSAENLASGRGVIAESKLLAKPLWPRMRPFIHQYFERASASGVSADYRRLGAGLQTTLPVLGVVEAEVQQELSRRRQAGVSLTGRFTLSDQWLLRGRVDSNSVEVPLAARYSAISGWLAGVGLAYRDSERWTVSVDISQLGMSDRNTRRTALLRGAATVMQDAFYQGSVELELYQATNSIGNATYFNPSRSRTLLLSYVSDWTNFRRYHQSFGQLVKVSLGRQAESGFATGTIGGIDYEQAVSVSDTLSLNYGAGFVRRFYGGKMSSGLQLQLNLNWKLL